MGCDDKMDQWLFVHRLNCKDKMTEFVKLSLGCMVDIDEMEWKDLRNEVVQKHEGCMTFLQGNLIVLVSVLVYFPLVFFCFWFFCSILSLDHCLFRQTNQFPNHNCRFDFHNICNFCHIIFESEQWQRYSKIWICNSCANDRISSFFCKSLHQVSIVK